jgi:hypothetical protein
VTTRTQEISVFFTQPLLRDFSSMQSIVHECFSNERRRLTRFRPRTSAIVLLLCGCQPTRVDTMPRPDALPPTYAAPFVHPFFCERSYTNHARGYQHRGIYVDGGGAAFRYQHERDDSRLLRVPADSLTERALLARYTPGRTPIEPLMSAEMAQQRYAQVLQAREGALSDRTRRGADMGAIVRRCYLPDGAGVYREVLLRQTGDWERHNTSPAAVELSAWLDSLAFSAR